MTITVTATDADGLSVSLELLVTIEVAPRGFLRGWWRLLAIDGLPAAPEDAAAPPLPEL